MADFAIQRGQATIALDAGTVTISAGTEYTAPASNTAAFIRAVGSMQTGGGVQDSDFNGAVDRNCIQIQDPANITTSITLERSTANGGPIDIEWEIIEYTGFAGGANEMIVRLAEVLAITTASDATVDSSTFTPSDGNDVVVFITGTNVTTPAGRNDTEEFCFTSEYVSASTLARFTRGGTTNRVIELSMAAVEFTGSNWKIQREEHAYSSDATDETEAIATTLGAVTKAFIHHQSRVNGVNAGADGGGQECHISSTSQLTFNKDDVGGGTAIGVAWIMENTQSDGTPLLTEQFSGIRATNTGGDPDSFTQAVTSQTLAESSIMGEGCNTTDVNDAHRVMLGFRLTAAATVTMFRGRDIANRDWRFEHVLWPTVAAGGSAALTGTAIAGGVLESEIVTGGDTIIITLTGDTWVAAGATFDAQRQNIIDGLDSAQSEAAGWNVEVRDKEVVGAVVRTSDTVVTVTLTAAAAYVITADETITVTVPATALVTSVSAIIATPTFDVTNEVITAGQLLSIGNNLTGGHNRLHGGMLT